jgi:hypothetical protein
MEIRQKKTDIKRLFIQPKRITITKLSTKVVTDISVYKDKQIIRVSANVLNRCSFKI